jgi:hypothetical protein
VKIKSIYGFFILMVVLSGCHVYSFTGASISPDIKTITIRQFQNNASYVQPRLTQLLTDALKDRFMSQTSLNIVPDNADLFLSGVITDYNTKPIAIQGNETAALNRLSVTITVKYINKKNEKQNFESSFSRYRDYQSNLSLSAVEEQLLKEIVDELVDDIFNKSVVNW